jgi:hypothetical protein
MPRLPKKSDCVSRNWNAMNFIFQSDVVKHVLSANSSKILYGTEFSRTFNRN